MGGSPPRRFRCHCITCSVSFQRMFSTLYRRRVNECSGRSAVDIERTPAAPSPSRAARMARSPRTAPRTFAWVWVTRSSFDLNFNLSLSLSLSQNKISIFTFHLSLSLSFFHFDFDFDFDFHPKFFMFLLSSFVQKALSSFVQKAKKQKVK